jgi:hypothetical protein
MKSLMAIYEKTNQVYLFYRTGGESIGYWIEKQGKEMGGFPTSFSLALQLEKRLRVEGFKLFKLKTLEAIPEKECNHKVGTVCFKCADFPTI